MFDLIYISLDRFLCNSDKTREGSYTLETFDEFERLSSDLVSRHVVGWILLFLLAVAVRSRLTGGL